MVENSPVYKERATFERQGPKGIIHYLQLDSGGPATVPRHQRLAGPISFSIYNHLLSRHAGISLFDSESQSEGGAPTFIGIVDWLYRTLPMSLVEEG